MAKPREISEVEYVWDKPGESTPTTKVTHATKIGDKTCAVGHYR